MDPLDQQLTEAGAAWRRSRRPSPDLDEIVAGLDLRTPRRRWALPAMLAAALGVLVLAAMLGPRLPGVGFVPTGSDDPSRVWLLTADGPSAACREALGGGRLVADPRSGLAVTDSDGEATVVRWPFGFTAHRVAGRIALVDPTGRTVAGEGDTIRFAGGHDGEGTWSVCPWDSVVVIEPWSSPASTAPAATPTAVPAPSESPLPEPPPFPGLPTMRAGEITVAGAGAGGCWTVLYADTVWGGDSCGPGSFPLGVASTTVAAGSEVVVGYDGGARLAWGTFDSRRVELSVRAAPISSLTGLGEFEQNELPSAAASLDLPARFDAAAGAVITEVPTAPGDYLVQVSAAVQVGNWTWTGTHFYYRITVP
jgi:hypothetical protein